MLDSHISYWFKRRISKIQILFHAQSYLDLFLTLGIGQQTKTFDDGKQVFMTFFTEDNLDKQNAMCQYWDMSGKQGGEISKL